jgi:energy-dependent translational throttle protein EttA
MQFIYTMKGLGKIHPPDHVVLKDIWLSFLPGAKIGVLGLNGAGKSTLLRIMAGDDQQFVGEAWPADGISVGFLQQEPRLDPSKSVLGNVEEGVAEIKALLTRYDEINAKFGEELSAEEMDKVLDEQGKVQDRIEAVNGWDLDSRLELAMDASRSAGCCFSRPTCCSSTSRRTISMPNQWRGSSAFSRTIREPSSR